MITQDELKTKLDYNSETGKFVWKVKPSPRFPSGMNAGCVTNMYVYITINGKRMAAHRLAWLYVHGEHPEHQIDHINGDPSDNRISNLRKATQFENAQNIRRPQKNNPHGSLGITYDPHKKLWRARISVNNKRKYIGKYKSQEEAAQAYIDAKRLLHPFNTL